MTVHCVWSHPVHARRALGFLNDGYGRLIFEWDERVWHYWRHLVWDGRGPSDRTTQPPEADAYVLSPAETQLLLGVEPPEGTTCVLFVVFEDRDGEWAPLWAAVVSDSPLEAEDVAEDTDNM